MKNKCDMCHKNGLQIPTMLGEYLGENNPNLCENCKDILEPLSEQTTKLIIWEINRLNKDVEPLFDNEDK
jgi:hypothetical protein